MILTIILTIINYTCSTMMYNESFARLVVLYAAFKAMQEWSEVTKAVL